MITFPTSHGGVLTHVPSSIPAPCAREIVMLIQIAKWVWSVLNVALGRVRWFRDVGLAVMVIYLELIIVMILAVMLRLL